MIKITPSSQWTKTFELFKEMKARYKWFLFEFGRRMALMMHAELLGRISKIQGSEDYVKRLVVAEMREKGGTAWWAIVASTRSFNQVDMSENEALLRVVNRLELPSPSPIRDLLMKYNPWTVSTLPYVPSFREAVVHIEKVSREDVLAIEKERLDKQNEITELMESLGVDYETRFAVRMKLNVISDLEVDALRWEFGVVEGGNPHWRPTIKWAKNEGVNVLAKDKELIKGLTDLGFKKYKQKKHVRERITEEEIKSLEDFQRKIIKESIKG